MRVNKYIFIRTRTHRTYSILYITHTAGTLTTNNVVDEVNGDHEVDEEENWSRIEPTIRLHHHIRITVDHCELTNTLHDIHRPLNRLYASIITSGLL